MNGYVVDLAHSSDTAPDRVGPKTATLARLRRSGLPVPDGVCLTAAVYRAQLAAAGVEESARRVVAADGFEQRRLALEVRLAFQRVPLAPDVAAALSDAWTRVTAQPGALVADQRRAHIGQRRTVAVLGRSDPTLGWARSPSILHARSAGRLAPAPGNRRLVS